jgi:hypothetical protein
VVSYRQVFRLKFCLHLSYICAACPASTIFYLITSCSAKSTDYGSPHYSILLPLHPSQVQMLPQHPVLTPSVSEVTYHVSNSHKKIRYFLGTLLLLFELRRGLSSSIFLKFVFIIVIVRFALWKRGTCLPFCLLFCAGMYNYHTSGLEPK